MMTLIILSTLTSSTLTLYLSSTPIILGLNILIMALLLSATFALIMSSWYAFMAFLIYIGGMLVMFAYFMALTPNQQSISMNPMQTIIITLIILSSMTMSHTTQKMPALFSQEFSTLYSKMATPVLIILALVLLLTMVIVVKLTTRSKGPLRPFNM